METYDDSFNKCNKTSNSKKIQDKKNKDNLEKSLVFRKHHGLVNKINLNSTAHSKLLYKRCVSKNHKNELKLKTPNMHCYSNMSFNYIVGHWKNEIANVIYNMQKRQQTFLKNAKAYNM